MKNKLVKGLILLTGLSFTAMMSTIIVAIWDADDKRSYLEGTTEILGYNDMMLEQLGMTAGFVAGIAILIAYFIGVLSLDFKD